MAKPRPWTPRFICWRVDLGRNRIAYVTGITSDRSYKSKDRSTKWSYTDKKASARTLSPELVKEFEETVKREGGISFCKSAYDMARGLSSARRGRRSRR